MKTGYTLRKPPSTLAPLDSFELSISRTCMEVGVHIGTRTFHLCIKWSQNLWFLLRGNRANRCTTVLSYCKLIALYIIYTVDMTINFNRIKMSFFHWIFSQDVTPGAVANKGKNICRRMAIVLNGFCLRHKRKATASAVLVKMYSQLSKDHFLHSLLFNGMIIARHASFAFTYCRGCRPESMGEKEMAFHFPITGSQRRAARWWTGENTFHRGRPHRL